MLSSRSVLLPALLVALQLCSCSRTQYRLRADRDAYTAIAERNADPRWSADDPTIDIDPRSRYFDPYDPDCPPMPMDDPTSHRYMQCVDGKRGWKHWRDFGLRGELENPSWGVSLEDYVELNEDGAVKLDLDSALKLAYVHSPDHQSQLETLYLTALDVTGERFQLDTQLFAGYNALYNHNGSLAPAALVYDASRGGYVVVPPVDIPGAENNRLTLGKSPAVELQRRFATAGQLLVGFANSFVFEFTGGDANLSASLANFTFIQPLLRGAGRDIALEQLTFEERVLLANLRAYGQFRQGFFTQVAIGELGVSGPRRGSSTTNLTVSPAPLFVGGYAGLLQQLQQIRNSEDNLSLQSRTLNQLEALLAVGVIDLVQVDQFRQNFENDSSQLLFSRNQFERTLDTYKTRTLGLPPDLDLELDDSLIQQFQLVPREATQLQNAIGDLQNLVGELPEDTPPAALQEVLTQAERLLAEVQQRLDAVEDDLVEMERKAPTREETMSAEQRDEFQQERQRLHQALSDLRTQTNASAASLQELVSNVDPMALEGTARGIVVWLGDLLRYVQRSLLVQALARLESVTIETMSLEPSRAFDIALTNRLDFMNGRAALVDSWRLVQVRADALQSVLNLTGSGDIGTARNNPLSFRAPTGTVRMGVEFDAPVTRLLERNAYREALVSYQRNRRDLIQSRDALHLGLRALLRQIEQLEANLEIQRRSVAIAIRQVDLTRARLYAPVPPPRPGQRAAQFGPTAARDLLNALRSLLQTQNFFLDTWLQYYAARMRLAREMGLMRLDANGRWVPETLSEDTEMLPTPVELPPAVPPPADETPDELPPPLPTPPAASAPASSTAARQWPSAVATPRHGRSAR